MFNPNDPSLFTPRQVFAIFAAICVPYLALFVWFARYMKRKPARIGSAIVIVLGDFGRSPRMMYHAKSLVEHGWETAVVAYKGAAPIPALLEQPGIHLHYIPTAPFGFLPWPLRAPIRIVHQSLYVLWRIWFSIPVHCETVIVQSPPAIPTLFLVQLAVTVTGSKLIIDWHNTGHSVLAQRLGRWNPLVAVAKFIEKVTGQDAFAHLFVTRALRDHLRATYDLIGHHAVLYDRPPKHFKRTGEMQQHDLFTRIAPDIQPPLPPSEVGSTLFTTANDHIVHMREDRPRLVISSTSWTPDEDFGLLLTALDQYDLSELPPLVVLITGKGPLRGLFQKQIALRKWTRVTVRCLFVDAKDYPTLLGCADLGISLHTSTSGMDLPMKVVDMYGCGVPVLAKHFACVDELVTQGTFNDGKELGTLIERFFAGELQLEARKLDPWETNWDGIMYKGLLRRS